MEYAKKNKAKTSKRVSEWQKNNKERSREIKSAWEKRNSGYMNAKTAKRRAARIQRTPSWADLDKIKDIYKDCEEINLAAKTAGCTEKFVVDHEIPLQGDNVSGLHVHTNLQIITDFDNSSKNNSFIPGAY